MTVGESHVGSGGKVLIKKGLEDRDFLRRQLSRSLLRPDCAQRVKRTQDLFPFFTELYAVRTAIPPDRFALDIPGPFQAIKQTGDVLRRDQGIFTDLCGSDPRLSSKTDVSERKPLLRGQSIRASQAVSHLSPYVCQPEGTEDQIESRGVFCRTRSHSF